MDAQEIVNKHGDGNERLHFHIANHTIILFTDSVQCLRRLIGRKRREQNLHMTIRVGRADIVLDALGSASHRVVHMAVQNFMQLQDIVLRNGNGIETLMDDVQDIAVACDFLFIAVLGRCLFLDQLLDTGAGGDNALDSIGCLRALHLCNLHQFFQFLRALFQVHLLFPGFFIDRRNKAEDFRIPHFVLDFRIIESSHYLTSHSFPLNNSL